MKNLLQLLKNENSIFVFSHFRYYLGKPSRAIISHATIIAIMIISFSNISAQNCGSVTSFNGALDVSDPTYNRIFIVFGGCTFSGTGSNVFYETQSLTVDKPGMYQFMNTGWHRGFNRCNL